MLGERPSSAQTRRIVTVMFVDLVDSTALTSRLDAEVARDILGGFYGVSADAVERHGAVVEKYIGDAVMALFGVVEMREDDALRAVRTAQEIVAGVDILQARLPARLEVGLAVRVGIATGEVVAGGRVGSLASGTAVNLAARLQAAASSGSILIDDATRQRVGHVVQVDPMAPLELKGIPGVTTAYAVGGSLGPDEAIPRRLDNPLVGREGELAALHGALETVVSSRRPGSVAIVGPAGIGKSRLVHEFVAGARRDGARVLRGRCRPYGASVAYGPVADVVLAGAGVVAEDDRERALARITEVAAPLAEGDLVARRLATLVGLLDEPAPAEEAAWAFRRYVELLARSAPTVVVIDDVQWAERSLLDLLSDLGERAADCAVLLVAIARPDEGSSHDEWLGARKVQIALGPLPPDGVAEMVLREVGWAVPEDELAAWIADVTDGNPLYVEQYLALLADDGFIHQDGSRTVLVRPLADLPTPPSVEAIIASRLDRLPEAERRVAELASVVGRTFWRGAVVALAGDGASASVDESLAALRRRDLLLPDQSAFRDDEAHRFRHVLVRDAAYRRLTKSDRADLHERVAGWLERRAADRLDEHRELVGFHLEQATELRRTLALDDGRTDAVAEAAASHLVVAARRALSIGDFAGGAALLLRADRLRPRVSVPRLEAVADLARALIETGRAAEAVAVTAEAFDVAERMGDERLILHAEVDRAFAAALVDGTSPNADLSSVSDRFAAIGDLLGQAKALQLLAWDLFQEERVEAALEVGERVAGLARRSGIGRLEHGDLLHGTSYYGPTRASVALAEAERKHADPSAGPVRRGAALIDIALMRSILGDSAGARAAFSEADATWAEVGSDRWRLGRSEFAAVIEEEGGDRAAAECALRDGVARLEDGGARGYLAYHLLRLADLLAREGRKDEAAAALARAVEMEDPSAHRRGESQVLAASAAIASLGGDHRRAFDEARRALALMAGSDWTARQADVRLAVARIYSSAGQVAAARTTAREALALYEQKEHLTGATRARAFLAAIATE